jgi:predicted Co/Zn/Cd cation transporter (cation efflux family)
VRLDDDDDDYERFSVGAWSIEDQVVVLNDTLASCFAYTVHAYA